jgi:Ca-activated chloride channel homolog
MKTNITLSNGHVLQDSPSTVNVLVSISAPPAPTIEKAPVDVIIVADRSGSMGGSKLNSVREAIASLIRQLAPQDRLGVVTFDHGVDVVVELGEHNSADATTKIRGIRSGGNTNLSGGWLKACEILTKSRRPEAIARIVVLTDGHANSGIVEPDAVATMTSGAARNGITTSVIGFGDDYDEEFIALMADAGQGNDYFCAGPDQALDVFAAEFAGLATVVAQNISVVARATNEATSIRLLNQQVTSGDEHDLRVAIGDAFGEETRRCVLAFDISSQTEPGLKHIADITVRWASVVGDPQLHEVTFPVEVTVTADFALVGEDDLRVVEEVRKLHVEDLRLKSLAASREGDFGTSARLMNEVLLNLTELGASESELDEVREWTVASAPMDAMSTKRMYSMSRSSSRGRRKRFDPDNS